MVHQDGPVPRVPVQGNESVFTDLLGGGEFGEVFVDAQARGFGSCMIFGRHAVLGEPAEDVAHPGLAGLVTQSPSTIPPSTTPHMPGTSRSSEPFMTWHVEVPMIATSCPGSTAGRRAR
ncbi:hypothetical protein AHiyo8_05760 [Arthrobacter sp. Hiyo8]|nr:hypothetical protein AHiyo8_05760 [Arthrobacter sp. Hiyo8]